jgi:transposase InsO family protein
VKRLRQIESENARCEEAVGRAMIEDFRPQYNEVRPHPSLGQLTPAQFERRLSSTNPERAISEAQIGP